jgi:outer membrane protein assembly factor BamB
MAAVCGLGGDTVPGGRQGVTRMPPPKGMDPGAGMVEYRAKNEDPDMVRLILPQRGATEETAELLFVGGRKRRTYSNRFNVLCWDMKANRMLWETPEILLHGRTSEGGEGFEVGFEEVFLWKDLAVVHGRFDVVAFDRRPGEGLWAKGTRRGKKKRHWHFRVPKGFEIKQMDLCGDVLVLCGQGSTVALSPGTGKIIWEAPEVGAIYAGPFFLKDELLTVRTGPAEVSFRKVGSGRLLCRLRLNSLTTNRKHPVHDVGGAGAHPAAAEDAEAYPTAFGDGYLAVTDGLAYHVVDVRKRQLVWTRGVTKVDPGKETSFRLWINGGKLFVLKPFYAVLENAVLDLESGDMLWRRREGGKKVDRKLQAYAGKETEEEAARAGKAATGLVLTSMTFLDGKVYGIRHRAGTSSVDLVGMDPDTGNQTMKVSETGYQSPEAHVEPSWSEGCVTVRVQDGNNFEVWQVDTRGKRLVRKLKQTGYGRLGAYGDTSAAWQGPYQAIWAFAERVLTTPRK